MLKSSPNSKELVQRCHCGNRTLLSEKPFERKSSGWFTLGNKKERNTLLARFLRMNEFKNEICSSWFAPVGSASDYPLLSKWVIYGESNCSNGSYAGLPDDISPVYSLWAIFIGLYIANYIVERSTGWALSHPMSLKEFEKLKKSKCSLTFWIWFLSTLGHLLTYSRQFLI